jgi:hypothetical protein
MHDAGYVAAGYTLTIAMLAGYRWHLAVRTRRARRYVTAVTGRARGQGPRDEGTARWRRRP